MKCRRCRERAVIELRRHNAGFCRECFIDHCRRQVDRAISDHKMCARDETVLVGVSGGKDSLALWDILGAIGYEATGVYIDLGIGEYSERSHKCARDYANSSGLELKVVSLADQADFDIPSGARRAGRPACSVCGISKRHWLNEAARLGNFDAVATGHNLDDEAATLLGNVLHWQSEYIARQAAVLPATEDGFVRKIKPLVRLGERETAAYCVLSGIEYIVEECPMVKGNTGLTYKAALDLLEDASPGTRQMFLYGFYRDARSRFSDEAGDVELIACSKCGSPTPSSVEPLCAYCRMRDRAGSRQKRND